MNISSANLNKIMFGAGALIILLMVFGTMSNSMQRGKMVTQCKNGDIDVCTKLIESRTLSPKELTMAYAIRGYYYDKKGDYDKALEDYNEDIKMNAEEPALYLQRGGVYTNKSDFSNAIPDFTTAIKLSTSPTVLVAAHCGRGASELKKGDLNGARNDLQQAKTAAGALGAECVHKLEQDLGNQPTGTPAATP